VKIDDFSAYAVHGLDQPFNFGGAVIHRIGEYPISHGYYGTFYLSDFIFLDLNEGQSMASPEDFGEFKSGVWVPRKYTGPYGTNGFHLDFNDAANLGKDVSGNDNDFTTHGSPVQVLDTPTNNYCTIYPMDNGGQTWTTKEGNTWIQNNNASSYGYTAKSLISVSSGKWYWEVEPYPSPTDWPKIGICKANFRTGYTTSQIYPDLYYSRFQGQIVINNGTVISQSGLPTTTTGDIVGLAMDMDLGEIQFYKNNTPIGNPEPFDTSEPWTPCIGSYGDSWSKFYFGSMDFNYDPPSGFKALCTKNLPEPEILEPSKGFDIVTRLGMGTEYNVHQIGHAPDLIWTKDRDTNVSHRLVNSVHGAGKALCSDVSGAELIEPDGIKAFRTDGYTLGTDAAYNDNGHSFVDWLWKADPKFGFDIVKYTGDGTSVRAVNHNLGAVPEAYVIKSVDNEGTINSWAFRFTTLPNYGYLLLMNSDTVNSHSSYIPSTPIDSNTIYVGDWDGVNKVGLEFIAYLWRSIPGYSKIGSYVGNGVADGPFVWCGFRPRWVLAKNTQAASHWFIVDTDRDTFNVCREQLYPNENSPADSASTVFDILSNGFKVRNTSTQVNGGNDTIVYMAFAEQPFKYANAR
jgi:hypothetical protein